MEPTKAPKPLQPKDEIHLSLVEIHRRMESAIANCSFRLGPSARVSEVWIGTEDRKDMQLAGARVEDGGQYTLPNGWSVTLRFAYDLRCCRASGQSIGWDEREPAPPD